MNRRLVFLISALLAANPIARAATLTVTSLADSGPGSLREALDTVPPGGQIQFASNLVGQTIGLSSGLTVSRNVTISGPGAGKLVLYGGYPFVSLTVSTGVNVAVSGLTFSGWSSSLLNDHGNLAVSNCVIGPTTWHSVGVETRGGKTILQGCTIRENHTAVINQTGEVRITSCTIADNQNGFANEPAGVLNRGLMEIHNSTITGNRAYSGYAGIQNEGGCLLLQNSIAAANVAFGVGYPNLTNDLAGEVVSGGHNLISAQVNAGPLTNGWSGDLVGTTNAPIDPLLSPLRDNGGPTPTRSFLSGVLRSMRARTRSGVFQATVAAA